MKISIKEKFLSAIIITSFIIILATPVFLWVLFIKNFQQSILVKQEILLFSPAFSGMLISSLFFVALGIMFCALFFEVALWKSKSMREFIQKIIIKEKRNTSLKEIKSLAKLILITILIGIPVLILCFFNYSYVTQTHLYYNSFFSLSEKNISLDNLEKVQAGLWYRHGKYTGLEYEYILVFSNQKKYNLKEAGFENLLKLDRYLKSKNIPKEISVFEEEALQYIEKNWDAKRVEEMKELLGIN